MKLAFFGQFLTALTPQAVYKCACGWYGDSSYLAPDHLDNFDLCPNCGRIAQLLNNYKSKI